MSRQPRTARVCDNCGAFEHPPTRFRCCGGCLTVSYCSPECQQIRWSSHRAICAHTAEQMAKARVQAQSLFGEDGMVKCLRKFASAHEVLLGWAGYQALQLKRIPANIRQSALLIELDYQNHPESHRRFSLMGTHIVPIDFVSDPQTKAEIHQREARSRACGGLGALVVLLQCGTVGEVMPIEIASLNNITWDVRDDWESVLEHYVSEGRKDFKPRSTTSRGVIYG